MPLISRFPDIDVLHKKHVTLCGANTSSQKAYLLNSLHKKYNVAFLIVCTNDEEAENLFRDLVFLHKELKNIVYFPGWGKNIPSLEESSARSVALYYLLKHNPSFIITSIKGISQKTIPLSVFIDHILSLSLNDSVNLEALSRKLQEMGYSDSPLVDGPGLYSIRGYILDVYPPHKKNPFRIELFGDAIESIRSFDPQTQKSIEEFNEVNLIPVREIILNENFIKIFLKKFKEHADKTDIPKKIRDDISDEFKNRIFFHGIDAYVPFVYEEPSYLFDYLSKNTISISNKPWMETVFDSPLSEMNMESKDFYLTHTDLLEQLEKFSQLFFQDISQGIEGEIFFSFQDHTDLKLKLKSHVLKKETLLDPLFEHLSIWKNQEYEIHSFCFFDCTCSFCFGEKVFRKSSFRYRPWIKVRKNVTISSNCKSYFRAFFNIFGFYLFFH